MYEENKYTEDQKLKLIEERKASAILLRDLAVDFEEQLYSVKINLKSRLSLLEIKELELSERERTKVHYRDVFTPLYNKSLDTNDLLQEINQLKEEIDAILESKEKLIQKIQGLRSAAQSIDILVTEAENIIVNEDQRQNIIDKGLSLLEAQELERQRIARDLHDTTVQNLTSLVHKSELCAKLIDIDTIRAKLELNTMSNTIKSVINDMRGIIYNLKPMTLDDLGLTITVQRYANKIMDFNNIQVKVQANEERKEILPVIRLTLFRIIQEACNNILKHANASLINIDINYDENRIHLKIRDNGSGFNMDEIYPNSPEQASSFGLTFMRERTSLLSGKFEIQSDKGKGTIITVSVPFSKCEEERNEQTD
jgi:two-component system, NarL family, sensor histidine kinase DegS